VAKQAWPVTCASDALHKSEPRPALSRMCPQGLSCSEALPSRGTSFFDK
jgi:hypothetical protein